MNIVLPEQSAKTLNYATLRWWGAVNLRMLRTKQALAFRDEDNLTHSGCVNDMNEENMSRPGLEPDKWGTNPRVSNDNRLA